MVDVPGAGTQRLIEAPEMYLVLQADAPLAPSFRLPLWALDRVELGRSPDDQHHHEIVERTLRLRLPDRRMSSRHAVVEVNHAASGSAVFRDLGSKNGTYLNGRVVKEGPLEDGDVLELGHSFFLFRSAAPRWTDLDVRPRVLKDPELATFDATLGHAFATAVDVAPTDLGILLTGDSGTGKEVLARAIHDLSGRSGPFVVLDPGALTEQSADKILFGSAADGDADAPAGLIDAAEHGTLFLDEVSDLPAAWQAALLRVIEERVVPTPGGADTRPVSFRPIGTSHRSLDEEASAGRFRVDLLGRIAGARIHIVPLQDRKQDLGLLIRGILMRTVSEPATVRLRRRSVLALLRYGWPYNVRELEAAIRYGLIRAKSEPIAVEHLPTAMHTFVGERSQGRPPSVELSSPTPKKREAPSGSSTNEINPEPVPQTGLSVRLLGPLEVWLNGERMTLPPSKKVRALLSYLVGTGRPHRRERLSAIFCELADQQRAALRWQLSKVRSVLNAEGVDRLLANREEVSVLLDAMDVDLHVVKSAVSHSLDDEPVSSLDHWAKLYRGAFLEGLTLSDCADFEAWRVAAAEETLAWRVKILRALLRHADDAPSVVLPHARDLQALVPDEPLVGIQVNALASKVRQMSLRDGV